MIYKIFPTKDAFVTNYVLRGTNMTGSNTGGSEILELFRRRDPFDSANILIQFDTSVTSSIRPGPSASYWLHLYDAQHGQTLPSGYDAVITQVSQDWAEGKGQDLDFWTDGGYCNWSYSKVGVPWVSGGAYPSILPITGATFFFDNGHEDLVEDVTALLPSASYGFHVTVDPALTAENYYVKAFFARNTHYTNKRPCLEVRWNDATGTLTSFFRGWVDPVGLLQTSLYDLKSVYSTRDSPTLHLYVRPRDFNPAVQTSASVTLTFSSGTWTSGSIRMGSDAVSSVLTNAYYRVMDDRSDEEVIPFGTGSEPWTKLSYNDEGNYFKMYMQNFATGSLYRIEFMYEAPSGSGDWTIIRDDNNKFRVR